MNGACNGTVFWPRPLGPGGGAKSLNIIQFQIQSKFQRFLNQTFRVFSQIERYKTYQTGYSFRHLGHAPGLGLGVTVGVQGGQIFSFEIQPDLVVELLI